MSEIEKKIISVIMPVFLGTYNGCASDRKNKFIRAVNSFISQDYQNKELIIVSDACLEAKTIYEKQFLKHDNIKFKYCASKNALFSGFLRHIGIDMAAGDIICYLDSDDIFGDKHLTAIANNFNTEEIDWCYFDDFVKYFHLSHIKPDRRPVTVSKGSIGTSSIAHKKSVHASWLNCNGYGHDWEFICRLVLYNSRYKKIDGTKYIVCHIPNTTDV